MNEASFIVSEMRPTSAGRRITAMVSIFFYLKFTNIWANSSFRADPHSHRKKSLILG